MFKKLLVTALTGTAVFALATACTANTTDTPPTPTAVAATSSNPSPTAAPSGTASSIYAISDTPFKKATADQVVHAWTTKWHPRFQVIQTPLVHIRQAVIDNPIGAGTLELDVSQKGSGKTPGAVQIGFFLRNPSTTGYIKVTPKEMTTLFQDCFSPALSETQVKQTSSWISSANPNRETGASQAFPGLQMSFLNGAGQFSVVINSR